MLSCQRLVKSVLAKSHSVKGTRRYLRSGGENNWPLASVILSLIIAHQPLKLKELLCFGEDPFQDKTWGASGWSQMETAKHSTLSRVFMMDVE